MPQTKPLPVWAQQPNGAPAPSNKDVAVALARLGIRVFPCNGDRTPTVKGWEDASTTDVKKVDGWHAAYIPAIPPGVQGLVVIDCDRHRPGEDGVTAFKTLCQQQSISLENAFAVETPNSGRHYYFTSSKRYGNSDDLLPDGVNVRALGGYVIAPGATLPNGRSYRIVSGAWAAILPLPDALARLLREKRPDASPVACEAHVEALAALSQTTAIESDLGYFWKPFNAERAKLRALTEGRNVALMHLAKFAGNYMHNGLNRAEIEGALYSDSVANGYVAAHGKTAARTTIRHNITDGMAKPSGLPVSLVEAVHPDTWAVLDAMPASNRSKASVATVPSRKIALQSFADIEEEPITWLWNGYLPNGKYTLLAGAGGTGKSTIAFSLAAIITTGGLWPDGTRCQQVGNVLIWSSEDDPADTIKPRLMAAGADTSRCYCIAPHVDENGNHQPFDPARDMNKLREVVAELADGVSLFIIDPIVSAVANDMNKGSDVRRDLQAIVDFAAEQNCAVLGISHFAKGTAGKNSTERVAGSYSFTALARMVLAAAKEEDSERRVFTRTKSNNSVDTGGFSYTVQMVQGNARSGKLLETVRIQWGEELEGSSRSILAEVEEDVKQDDGTALGKAKDLLWGLLATGPMYAKDAESAAKDAGIASRTLRRAREALSINVEREKGFHAKVRWSLPFDTAAIAKIGGAPIVQKVASIPWKQVPS